EGVELLAPGQSLFTDWAGKPQQCRIYWQGPFNRTASHDSVDRGQAVMTLGHTPQPTVKQTPTAPVPPGRFLSGGIDSCAVASLATEVADAPVQTISIGFDQLEFDETDVAAAAAKSFGTEHRTVRLTGQTVLDDLPEALAAVDQPTVDGFNTYFVS